MAPFPISGALAGALLSSSFLLSTSAPAQDSVRLLDPARPGFWWLGGALLLAAAASDAAVERTSLANRSTTLDRLADAGHALGAGRHLLPVLSAAYLAGRWKASRVADAALHAAAGYAAGNVIASLGKPALGRHRPDTLGSPWRFRPLTRDGGWHSLPSAHALHAFTLAGALSEEVRRPWLTAVAYGAATLVAWSRVYQDEHWASDVVASAVVGSAIGVASVRLLHPPRPSARAVTFRGIVCSSSRNAREKG